MPIATQSVFAAMMAAALTDTGSDAVDHGQFKMTPGGTSVEGADFALPTAVAMHSCPCAVIHFC